MSHWTSGWETEERGLLVNKEKEQRSKLSLQSKEKKEKLGREQNLEGLKAKKIRSEDVGGGKKLLSWADQRKEEKKKEKRGKKVKLPKSENFVKKDEGLAGEEGKSDKKLSSKTENSGNSMEDDLTKELLSLLSPPPRIHIPESLDPSKVKLFVPAITCNGIDDL